MKTTTVFLVQLPNQLGDIVRQAAEVAFHGVKFIPASSIAEAARHAEQGRQLVVLGACDEEDLNAAAAMVDQAELPRWAVVNLGPSSSELVESVPLSECNPHLLSWVFRLLVQQHELLRENLALSGDLKTVARRFSHDLRSPLNCIHITCELMKELATQNELSVTPQIEVVQSSLFETFGVIDRFSYVLKASTEPAIPSAISMGEVVNRVLAHLVDAIEQSGAVMERPAQWPVVNGTAPWLEEIWKNLITNALRHGFPATPILLGWGKGEETWRFWVENQGAPLPASVQSQLFRRFEHLHTRPTSGLGLALVQRLVALQGGQCGYERCKGDSSLFYFTLPL